MAIRMVTFDVTRKTLAKGVGMSIKKDNSTAMPSQTLMDRGTSGKGPGTVCGNSLKRAKRTTFF
jgi:hypothetical protein